MVNNWLRQNYETKLANQLRDEVDYGIMTENEADLIFDKEMEKWEASYGDYLYDIKEDFLR